MKNLARTKNSLQGRLSIIYFILAVLGLGSFLSSCKKDKHEPEPPIVSAATSIRLVHSSVMQDPFLPGMTPVVTPADLYVDGVKVNTAGSIVFPDASAYFPLTSGQRKIEAKDAAGTAIADTTITIDEGMKYSFFIKDRSMLRNATTLEPLERQLIPVVDNNTTAPAEGKAKVRFVNANSITLNDARAPMTFMTVRKEGNATITNILTRNLGGDADRVIFKSDFVTLDAGEVTFRVQNIDGTTLNATYLADLSTTLVAGKLYTVYVVSTEYSIKTPTTSPLSLLIVNN